MAKPKLSRLEPYVDKIFGYALRRTHTREDAEDLSQEILLELCRSLSRNPRVKNMHAWLWRIAHNTRAKWTRRRLSDRVDVCDDIDSLNVVGWFTDSPNEQVDESLLKKESVQLLMTHLSRISSEYRDIVVMHYFEGKTVREIAEAKRLPEGTVKQRLHTARSRLKERMTDMASIEYVDAPRLAVYVHGRGTPWKYFTSTPFRKFVSERHGSQPSLQIGYGEPPIERLSAAVVVVLEIQYSPS